MTQHCATSRRDVIVRLVSPGTAATGQVFPAERRRRADRAACQRRRSAVLQSRQPAGLRPGWLCLRAGGDIPARFVGAAETLAKLCPHRAFHRVVTSVGGGTHALLCQQGDAGEPGGVVGQDVRAVGIGLDQACGRSCCLGACASIGTPSAAEPVTCSSSLRRMISSTSASPRCHLAIGGPHRWRGPLAGGVVWH